MGCRPVPKKNFAEKTRCRRIGIPRGRGHNQMGYRVTVFESKPLSGGMLHPGFPGYRLPCNILNQDVEAIEKLGVQTELNKALGKDFSLRNLINQGLKLSSLLSEFIRAGIYRWMGLIWTSYSRKLIFYEM